MLTKPDAGWSDFQLDGTPAYGLSYLDDIASDWLEQAIHGLETMNPFCVKAYMEPGRFLCVVSYYNCHIIYENEEKRLLDKEDIYIKYSHTSMINFYKFLYNDISENIDEWTTFVDYVNIDFEEHKKELENKLERLKNLITEREEDFNKSMWI
ncbi:MAG: hypothetical protein K2G36_04075 [Ruminococcus sp.]|nr:hypothetical protein [Ruminococcus sp.]